MNQNRNTKRLLIGAREVTIIALALAFLTLSAFVFTYGVLRFSGRTASTESVAGTPTERAAQITTTQQTQADTQPTPVLAPTIAPTITTVVHTVRDGETLIGIARLYGVDVQTILDANKLDASSTITPGQTLDVPLVPGTEGTWHEVKPGETLIAIAAQHGVTPEIVQAVNNLANADSIYVGQTLYIPSVNNPATPLVALTPTAASAPFDGPPMADWPRSIPNSDNFDALVANYPLTFEHQRFTLHYQPGTYVDHNLEQSVTLVTEALEYAETTLDVHLDGTFDVYLAGTLYAPPDAALHGRSESANRKVFILYDGTGTEIDNTYFFTHEITHLVAWNTLGIPSSPMLSEGVATYTGKIILESGGFLPYQELCAGAYAAGLMPSMYEINKDWYAYRGHIRHPINYFGSACFVDYLISTYGMSNLHQLYHTSSYEALYGKSLFDLDAEWQATLADYVPNLTMDPAELSAYTQEVSDAYAQVFNNYNGTMQMHQAYIAVDKARVALWQGNYPEVRYWLDEAYAISGFLP